MKILRTPREILDWCDALTPREADQFVKLMDSTPEIIEAARTKGLVIRLVRRRRGSKPLIASVNNDGKMEVCYSQH